MTIVFWKVDDDYYNAVNIANVKRITIAETINGIKIVFQLVNGDAVSYKISKMPSKEQVNLLLTRIISSPVVDLDEVISEVMNEG